MASRKIKPAEQAMLAALGDMTSPACEHVLALDGIAILVNKGNPINSLSRKQIQAIFSSQTKDWSEVGGRPGHIELFARDDRSGTYDTFKTLVLESAPLFHDAKRFEDSSALPLDWGKAYQRRLCGDDYGNVFVPQRQQVFLLCAIGLTAYPHVSLDACLVPFVLAGIYFGRCLLQTVSGPVFEEVTLGLTLVAGLSLLLPWA